MSKRITIKDVRPALANYAEACKAAGLIPEGMQIILSEGSQTYGRAWRVNLTGIMVRDADGHPTFPKGSGHSRPPVGDDYLGWTAAEALAALRDRTAGVWAGLKGKPPVPITTIETRFRAALEEIYADAEGANCTCEARGWYGDDHDTVCPLGIAGEALGVADSETPAQDAPDAGDLARDRMADAMQYRR